VRLTPNTDTVPASVNKYLLPHERQVITVKRHCRFYTYFGRTRLSRSDGGDAERGQVRSARTTAHWDHDAYYGPGWTEPEPVSGDSQDHR